MFDFVDSCDFPVFKRGSLHDILEYENFYSTHCAPYADLSPANLYTWLDIDGTLEFSRLGDGLVIRYQNTFDDNRYSYTSLVPSTDDDILHKIINLQKLEKHDLGLNEQPDKFIASSLLESRKFSVVPLRDSFEYILSTSEHASLQGSTFYQQRKQTRHFERTHANDDIAISLYGELSEEMQDLLMASLLKWGLTAQQDNEVGNRESEALVQSIATLQLFERECMVIHINNVMTGFAIFKIHKDTALIGHIKVDYSIQHMFDYVTHQIATYLNKKGVAYMNLEQDLGKEGLRIHKLRLRPQSFLTKSIIRPY